VPRDPAVAKDWFLKAAEKGHAGAQYALGMLYTRGEGVVADPDRALEWFRRAARNGHLDAQVRLGGLLAGKPGAPAEVQEEALFWLGEALDRLKPGELRSQAEAAARSIEQRLSPAQLEEVRRRRTDREQAAAGNSDPDRD
jgi:TPR repeat protein